MSKLVVAVLDTMWGLPGDAPPYFTINPDNYSGRRLYGLVGDARLLVTNSCRECVQSATQHGTPDPSWLHANLIQINAMRQIDVVLVCGKVAQATFTQCGWTGAEIITMPHPAARFVWTGALARHYTEAIARVLA